MKKIKEKLKNRKNLVAVLAVAGLLFITAGVSYAFFSYSRGGTTVNTMESGVIKFIYNESSRVGNGINLTDAMPMPDSVGKAQDKYFDFSVTGTTGEESSIPYEITARKTATSDDIGNAVKLYLTKVNGNNEEEQILSIYNSLPNSTNEIAVINHEKTLYKGTIPADEVDYTVNYRLRMWLNDNTTSGNVLEYTQTETGICSDDTYDNEADCVAANKNWTRTAVPMTAKTFTVKVNVYANGNTLTAASTRATISSVAVNNEVLTETTEDHYSLSLPAGTTQANIDVTTENEYTNVKIEKTDSTYTNVIAMNKIQRLSTIRTISLNPGLNYFKITATSEDGTDTKIIYLQVKVKQVVALRGLAKMIYDDNDVIETPANITKKFSASGDTAGLYVSEETDSGSPTYYFRGNVENNYVEFAGLTWRVIRINEDGTVKLFNQSYVTTSTQYCPSADALYYSTGINNTTYSMGYLDNWYNQNIGSNENYASKVADSTGHYFCETPVENISELDFTCKEQDGHQYVNSYVGLITLPEYIYAGGSTAGRGGIAGSEDTIYLNFAKSDWAWTLTPVSGNRIYSFEPGYAKVGFGITTTPITDKRVMRPVINLKADVTATKDANGHYVVN